MSRMYIKVEKVFIVLHINGKIDIYIQGCIKYTKNTKAKMYNTKPGCIIPIPNPWWINPNLGCIIPKLKHKLNV
jgi:hypothetical protein